MQRLTDAARSAVYRVPGTTEVEDAVRGTRLDLTRIDLTGVQDKEALLAKLALDLGFPAWFGGNWDALEDCLADLSWRVGDGHVLLVQGSGDLPLDDLGVLIDVLASSAEYWVGRGRPFFALFVDPQRALALPELFRPKGA